MKASFYGLGVVGLLAVASANASAAVILNNGNFEADAVADGGAIGAIAGWTPVGGVGVVNPATDQYAGTAIDGTLPSPADGQNTAYTNSSYFYQVVGKIELGHTYTLTYALGNRGSTPDSGSGEVLFRRDAATVNDLARGYYGGSDARPISVATPYPADGTFAQYAISFTATADNMDTGPDAAVNNNLYVVVNGSTQMAVDNLVLTDVPEPASLGLLGVGGLGLLARRRRIA